MYMVLLSKGAVWKKGRSTSHKTTRLVFRNWFFGNLFEIEFMKTSTFSQGIIIAEKTVDRDDVKEEI